MAKPKPTPKQNLAPIRVPKVPASAFDPDRPASTLLKSQVRVLQEAVLSAIHTEREAARQIGLLTAALRELRPQTAPQPHRGHRKTRRARQKAGRRRSRR